LTVTFPERRLLAPETRTAGWQIGGATAPVCESNFADAREPAVCRCIVWLLKTKHRINM
jgi:hypothetical protein